MAKADNIFDKRNRSVSKRCQICWWPFRCPVEQMTSRDMCSACESIAEAILEEKDDALHPST